MLEEFGKEYNIPISFPLKPMSIAAFISHLDLRGLAASTITAYLTGINYFQKSMGFKDLTSDLLVNKVMIGLQKRGVKRTPKAAVNLASLEKLITAAAMCLNNLHDIKTFQCYLSVQFFGLFRISELLGDPKLNIPALQMQHVQLKPNTALIDLISYKHSAGKGAEIQICQQFNSNICPIMLLKKYILVRGTGPGPFFVSSSGRPLSKRLCAAQLRRCCAAAGFTPNLFTSHCLRVGAASLAAQMGKSTAEIMTLGRWSSSAYVQYIRSVEPLMAPLNFSPRCGAALPPAQRHPWPQAAPPRASATRPTR